MEIGPVPGVRIEPRPRRTSSSRALPGILDVDTNAGLGDETYTPAAVRAAAGAEEDDSYSSESDNEQKDASENGGGSVSVVV